MEHNQKDVKDRLFHRLEQCLVSATRRVGQQSLHAGYEKINELQSLFDLHSYLKNTHMFAPGEADALLSFDDPLTVAQECWQENNFAPDFPICKILNEIGAYERFPLTLAEQESRKQPQVQKLKESLDKSIADYTASLLNKSKQELIAESENIAATQIAYSYMRSSYEYGYGEPDLLLQLDDPLKYLASRWSLSFDLWGGDDDLIQEIITDLEDPDNLRHAQDVCAAVQSDKLSLRGQLQAAMQAVSQRPSQDGRAQHQSDIPNL